MSEPYASTRVLVIGAGGGFGSRLAEGLARAGFELVLAGRDVARAEATATDFCLRIEGARVTTVRLDTRDLTATDLAATGAHVVVDAAGPFQGAAPRVARAAIAAGLHYVDLADARDFVASFPALDAAAKTGGVVALTGASSTPALSHAVLHTLTQAWQRIDSLEAAISPGARAPRGRSVTEAILSWLGRPVRVFEGGAWRERPGWSGLERRRFGPLSFDLMLTPDPVRLTYAVTGWRLGPIPLPSSLAPTTHTHEAVDAEGRFTFDVEIGLPWGARMVRYRGWLARDAV